MVFNVWAVIVSLGGVCVLSVRTVFLSLRLRKKERKVKRRKLTSVVARSGYKAYGLFIRLHGLVYGYSTGLLLVWGVTAVYASVRTCALG